MFNNLFNFEYKRNALEALGFYIAYFLLFILAGGLVGGLFSLLSGLDEKEAYEYGVKVGIFLAVVCCLTLSFLIIKAKKLYYNFLYIVLGILSGILALFLGGLGGLIPAVFLVTRESLSKTQSTETTNTSEVSTPSENSN